MSRYLSRLAQGITPYVPGEQPTRDMIKLNTNENPYPPSPRARAVAQDEALFAGLRRYSLPEYEPLRDLVAEQEGLPSRDYVYFGNGSDEVLMLAFGAFFDPGRPVRFADVTYSFYPVYCALFGLTPDIVPLRPDWTWQAADYAAPGGGIVLANPNAPTTLALSRQAVEEVVRQHPEEVVVVDEAYVLFGAETAVPLIHRYPNLLVVRTLSKSHSLAGMRVGYCMGQPELIDGIRRIKNSFNSYTLDAVAQAVALAALQDVAYAQETCRQIVRTRARATEQLRALGFELPDSLTNFLFAHHPQRPAREIFQALRERDILVRYFASPERVSDYLRITVGTEEEMDALAAALRDILA
jgi:histidinol-phosphate aminotransferase